MTSSSPHPSVMGADQTWQVPPPDLTLSDDEVHVWRAVLDLSAAQRERLWLLLSADEQARCGRMRFEWVRRHYLAARGILRMVLARYLQVQPESLHFEYNEHGKPLLAGPHAGTGLQFNLSHSHGLALYAVTLRRAVGVDLEYQRAKPLEDRMRIARRFFSKREYKALAALPEHRRQTAFFTCWTRKEAFVKAKGLGFALPLAQFDVSLTPDAPAEVLATRWDPAEADRWSLHALHPDEDYQGAVAVEGSAAEVVCWQWDTG